MSTTYNANIYIAQGGDTLGVKSGGTIAVASGGAVTAASGSTLTVSGTETVASGGILNVASGGKITVASGGYILRSVAAVDAAGANQGAATALAAEINVVGSADDAKGVRLPTAQAGMVIIVKNTVSNKDLLVYPATGAAINAVAANGAYTMADATSCIFVATSTTQWYTIPLLAS